MPVFFFGFFFPHITSCVLRTFFPRHIPTNSLSSVKGMRLVRNLRVREGERRGGGGKTEKKMLFDIFLVRLLQERMKEPLQTCSVRVINLANVS